MCPKASSSHLGPSDTSAQGAAQTFSEELRPKIKQIGGHLSWIHGVSKSQKSPPHLPPKKKIITKEKLKTSLQISHHISPLGLPIFLCSPGPRSPSRRWYPNTLSTTWSKPPSQISKNAGHATETKSHVGWGETSELMGVTWKNLAFFSGREKPPKCSIGEKK